MRDSPLRLTTSPGFPHTPRSSYRGSSRSLPESRPLRLVWRQASWLIVRGENSRGLRGSNSHSRAPTLRHYVKVLRTTLTAFLMLGAGAAVAGPREDGDAAYNRGDYATALHLLGPLADQGDTSAQNSLRASCLFNREYQANAKTSKRYKL